MLPILIVVVIVVAATGLRVVQQYQRGLVFRFGRYTSTRSAGLRWIIPIADRMQIVDVRVVTLHIEPQETMTRDNVPVKINDQLVAWAEFEAINGTLGMRITEWA